MTTGAFYGYFSSKEALFAAIVEPHAAALMGRYMEAQTSFAELPETEQPAHMGMESSAYIHWMVDYIRQHREPVKLLLCHSEGTSYEHFVHNMVEVEVEYTLKYMEVLRRLGQDIPKMCIRDRYENTRDIPCIKEIRPENCDEDQEDNDDQ